jgi:hypothetical protein
MLAHWRYVCCRVCLSVCAVVRARAAFQRGLAFIHHHHFAVSTLSRALPLTHAHNTNTTQQYYCQARAYLPICVPVVRSPCNKRAQPKSALLLCPSSSLSTLSLLLHAPQPSSSARAPNADRADSVSTGARPGQAMERRPVEGGRVPYRRPRQGSSLHHHHHLFLLTPPHCFSLLRTQNPAPNQ